ncbi:MAG: Gfo/Idh/MocA family oxidoreductase [Bacteroidales bacterium]|nr:Gfo/Idh/MocA family oxidoreductase [Bacteroidales bacterium]
MSVRLAVIGVGNRTGKYLHYFSLHPDVVELAAVVEPDPVRREACRKQFSLSEDRCFASSDDFFDRFREPCDGVIIGSPDRFHHAQALKAIERGWDILLEKPVAQSYGQCLEIADAARRRSVKVGVCYVLRFMSLYRKVKELLENGAIGRVTGVSHQEYVGIDRMLHTFVRGYWNRADLSAPSFVSKCCHDVDMLLWATGATIKQVQSAGSLAWYRPENAPEDSTDRCITCPVEPDCSYSAVDMYLRRGVWTRNFPVPEGKTLQEVLEEEMRSGRFGRCAFRCDNDVADRQVVTLTATDGILLTIEMNALTRREGRETVISGTRGEISVAGQVIEVRDRSGSLIQKLDFSGEAALPYHANADLLLVEDFIRAVATPGRQPAVTLADSLESHRICFLAG